MLEKLDIEGLYKDSETNAIINTDIGALKTYKTQKTQLRRMNSMENRIQILEKELRELKQLFLKTTHDD